MPRHSSGLFSAIAAFFLWGILPIFWKQLQFLPPLTIIAQRCLWSLLVLWLILLGRGQWYAWLNSLRQPRHLWQLALSGCLLASNWTLYVWATLHEHILDAALGYYLNPFFNMLIGGVFFAEKHARLQRVAMATALLGVSIQIITVGHFPWISLTLALTFALYAVSKKICPLPSQLALTTETLLLCPLALTWVFLTPAPLHGASAFGSSPIECALVIATGAATTIPLLFFNHAAKNISLTTLGILQFLGPSIQWLIGCLIYHEPLTPAVICSFALIWCAIALYAYHAIRVTKTPPPSPANT